MNHNILHKDVQDFIHKNLKSNLTQLILKGSPFDQISIQEIAAQIVGKQKSEKKLPSWFQTENIYYPPKLNLEQTSSEVTASYKANLLQGTSIIDITGGFGVDSYAFSKQFEKVVHCEMNEDLSTFAAHNFKQLKADNITCQIGDGIDFVKTSQEHVDCIFVDPSRRNDHKGKVFLLEDCKPNIPFHLDTLFEKTDQILIKTSPILDISSAIGELHSVKEVHVVAVSGEVKELLFLLEKKYTNNIFIKTVNFLKKGSQTFEFIFKQTAISSLSEPKKYLFEPNSAILKSGGFHQVSELLNIHKLHPHSHLYTADKLIDFPGRSFEVLEVISYDKKKLKKLFSKKKANITTRNFPKTVQQLRQELKIKDGGENYLFFTTTLVDRLVCIFTRKS